MPGVPAAVKRGLKQAVRMRWVGVAVLLALGMAAAATAAEASADEPMICPPGEECYPLHFEPTHAFQPIKPGQLIPPGLHVRLDWQTGQREARIDPDAQPADAHAHVSEEVAVHPAGSGEGEQPPLPRMTPERLEELKAAFEVIMEAVGSESRDLVSAVAAIKRADATEDELMDALDKLSDIVHMIDHGRDLATLNGTAALAALLSHDSARVRQTAAIVLGSALQNNPDVQLHALHQDGLLPILLERLGAEATDALSVRRYLFALASLLRGIDGSLGHLVADGGLDQLLRLMAALPSVDVYFKIGALASDLFAASTDEPSARAHCADLMRSLAWCESLGARLPAHHLPVIEQTAHFLLATADVCRAQAPWLREAAGKAAQFAAAHADGTDAAQALRRLVEALA